MKENSAVIMVKLKSHDIWVKSYVAHFGLPSELGATLIKKYNTYEKALALVLGGDIKLLEKTPEDTQYFSSDGIYSPCRVEYDSLSLDMLEDFVYRFYDNVWMLEVL